MALIHRPYSIFSKFFFSPPFTTNFSPSLVYNIHITQLKATAKAFIEDKEARDIVVYLDVYFLLNFIMDFVVLTFTNRACGYAASFLRLLLSATFGALWAVMVFTGSGSVKIILHLCTYLPTAYVMVWVISGTYRIKRNIKGVVMLYAFTFALSGVLNLLTMYTSFGSLITAKILSNPKLLVYIFIAAVTVKICVRSIARMIEIENYSVNAEIEVGSVRFSVRGLVDTGNHLRDPYSGKPVCVIDRRALPENIYIGSNEKMHYIPISSVGCGSGVIQVFTANKCRIYNSSTNMILSDVLIGISENVISTKGDYDMLVHPLILTRGDDYYGIKSSSRR